MGLYKVEVKQMSKKIDLIEFSRKGGNTTKAKYGHDHYSRIRKKGNETIKKRYGPEYFAKIARIGIEKRRRRKEEEQKPLIDKVADVLTGNKTDLV